LINLFEPFDEMKYILKKNTVFNHMRFCNSDTVHSVQGETFDEKITVYDVNIENFGMCARWAYVAITRSSNIFDNVSICCDVIHNNNIMNFNEKIKSYEKSDKEKGFIFDEVMYPRMTMNEFKKLFKKQSGGCSCCGHKVKLNWSFSGDLLAYSLNRKDNNHRGGHCIENLEITCVSCNYALK